MSRYLVLLDVALALEKTPLLARICPDRELRSSGREIPRKPVGYQWSIDNNRNDIERAGNNLSSAYRYLRSLHSARMLRLRSKRMPLDVDDGKIANIWSN